MTASHDDATGQPRSALGRWARRKAEVERERDAESTDEHANAAETAPPSGLSDPASESGSESPDGVENDAASVAVIDAETELLSDADMPDVESLGDGSDFSQFMNPGVSEALRKRALARLFRLPVFGIRDGLDDYDEDFRSFIPLGDTITADMRFEQQRLKERAQELLDQKEKDELAALEADAGSASEGGQSEDERIADTADDGRESAGDAEVRDRSGEPDYEDEDVGEAEDDVV